MTVKLGDCEESSIAITVAAEFADAMLYERNKRRAR